MPRTRLDSSGTVHLRVRSLAGTERETAGPIPEHLLDSPAGKRQRTLKRRVVGGYGVLLSAGFVIGYLLGTGPVAERLLVGLLGVFIGMIVAWLAALIVRVGLSVRDLLWGSTRLLPQAFLASR